MPNFAHRPGTLPRASLNCKQMPPRLRPHRLGHRLGDVFQLGCFRVEKLAAGLFFSLFLEKAGFESRIPLSPGREAEKQTGLRNWTPSSWHLQSQVAASRPVPTGGTAALPCPSPGAADATLLGFFGPSSSTPYERLHDARPCFHPSTRSLCCASPELIKEANFAPKIRLGKKVLTARLSFAGSFQNAPPKVQVLKPPRPQRTYIRCWPTGGLPAAHHCCRGAEGALCLSPDNTWTAPWHTQQIPGIQISLPEGSKFEFVQIVPTSRRLWKPLFEVFPFDPEGAHAWLRRVRLFPGLLREGWEGWNLDLIRWEGEAVVPNALSRLPAPPGGGGTVQERGVPPLSIRPGAPSCRHRLPGLTSSPPGVPAMGPRSSSGFYVSRAVALLLAGLAAGLLLALAVLSALYGHCARVAPSELHDCGVPDPRPSRPSGQGESPPARKPGPTREPAVAVTPDRRPSGPWDQLRLPSWLVPLHYELELWPRLRPDELSPPALHFTGRVNITLRCTVATALLLLHSLYLDCDRAEVRGPLSPGTGDATVGQVPVDKVWFALDMQYMVLELREALQPGSLYELQLSFSGLVYQNTREGLFLNVYTDQGERR